MKQLHRLQGVFLCMVLMSVYNTIKSSFVHQFLPDFDVTFNAMMDTVSGPWSMAKAHKCGASNRSIDTSTSPLIVIVMSAQSHFERRRAIRDTWANGHSNVYFVIGQPCPYAPEQRINDGSCTLDSNKTAVSNDNRAYSYQQRIEQNRLLKEQDVHHDLLFAHAKESYRSLPSKLKRGYEFVTENCPPSVKWILKADDDFYVRIRSLVDFIETETSNAKLDPSVPTVMGKFIWWSDPVRREGKNAELVYPKAGYPNYATGSYGHVVSRPIAAFVTQNQQTLEEYQGEDTSLGIWLKEQQQTTSSSSSSLTKPVKWVLAADQQGVTDWRLRKQFNDSGPFQFPYERLKSRFDGIGDCMEQKFYVIGHDITPAGMRACHKEDADVTRFRKVYSRAKVSVIVMSHRSNFAQRQAIRDTWAAEQTNVHFVLGQECRIPHDQRVWLKCELLCTVQATYRWTFLKSMFPCRLKANETHTKLLADEAALVKQEQVTYKDLILTSTVESYRGIVPKIKEAYSWVVANTDADWIVKADDDMYIRVELISKFLSRFSSSTPTVVGKINDLTTVWRNGKWADPEYKPNYYPKWAQGAAGHAVSRPIAEFIHKHRATLHNYQGEDVSIGIWLDESSLKDKVNWQNSRLMQMDKECSNSPAVAIGHEMTPERIRECHEELKDVDYIDFDAEDLKKGHEYTDPPDSEMEWPEYNPLDE